LDPSPTDWTQLLQDGLQEWAAARPEKASTKLEEALRLCSGQPLSPAAPEGLAPEPAQQFWKAILHNLQAVMASETGLYGQVQEFQDLALQIWTTAGLDRRPTGLPATLNRYSDQLRKAGLDAVADRLKALYQIGQAPLLDPWSNPKEQPPSAPTRLETKSSPEILRPSRLARSGALPLADPELPSSKGPLFRSRTSVASAVPKIEALRNAPPEAPLRPLPSIHQARPRPAVLVPESGALLGRKLFNSSAEVSPSQSMIHWEARWCEALTLAANGQLLKSVRILEEELRTAATQMLAHQRSLRLTWTYNIEAIAYFLAGDYTESTQAFQHAETHWNEIRTAKESWDGSATQEFIAALTQAGRTTEAAVVSDRVSRRVLPLLNPWQDLTGQLEQVAMSPHIEGGFSSDKDWKDKLERSVALLERKEYGQAQKQLARLLESLQKLGGSAGSHVQSILTQQLLVFCAFHLGEFAEAEVMFKEAAHQWSELSQAERRAGGWLTAMRSLLRDHNIDEMAAGVDDQLFNPFSSRTTSALGKPNQHLAELPPEADDELHSWDLWMRDAWTAARHRDFSKAFRCAVRAEDAAREVSSVNLHVCYAINTQAVLSFLIGNYPEADESYRQTTEVWKRSRSQATAKPAWNDFVRILGETGWSEQSRSLKSKWTGTGIPTYPALLTPSVDIGTEALIGYTTGSQQAEEAEIELAMKDRQQRASKVNSLAMLGLVLTLGLTLLQYHRSQLRPLELPDSTDWHDMTLSLKAPKVRKNGFTFDLAIDNPGNSSFFPDSIIWVYAQNPSSPLWQATFTSQGTVKAKGHRLAAMNWDGRDNSVRTVPKGHYHVAWGLTRQTPMLQQDLDVP
jgi:tetratricopeptide (TPR) repeat protein